MAGRVARDEVVGWLDAFLDAARVADYGPNGLQLEGRPDVARVAFGVSANLAFLEAAIAWGADLAVVHHGLFWEGAPLRLTGALGRRVRTAFAAGLSVAGYHLPLDAHPEVGNAASLARALGLSDPISEFPYRGLAIGCVARAEPAWTVEELTDRVRGRVSADVRCFPHGPDAIRRVGIVTGAAPREVTRALALSCDAYLTGEASEYSPATAREEGIHFVAAGHHRTERFGPQALAARLAAQFPALETGFFDVDNPV